LGLGVVRVTIDPVIDDRDFRCDRRFMVDNDSNCIEQIARFSLQLNQDLRARSQNLEGLVSKDRLKPCSFVETFEVCVSPVNV
jgi:hypothetical protein